MSEDLRWQQRFNTYIKIFRILKSDMELWQENRLSNTEKRGVIRDFRFANDISIHLLHDYLQEGGVRDIDTTADLIRQASKRNIVIDRQVWMDMIDARDQVQECYKQEVADKLFEQITTIFYPAFQQLMAKFTEIHERDQKA